MPEQEDIDDQLALLRTHRRTLSVYLRQRAELGFGYSPPGVINGIDETRRHIRHIKRVLHEWSQTVDDMPNDEEPDQTSPPALAPAPTPQALARELLTVLDVAYTAFQSQVDLRDPLVHMVQRRLQVREYYEYESFFAHFFNQMNREERYIHQRIRVQTETIRLANERAADLATQLQLDQKLPALPALRTHLAAWMEKYTTRFQQTPHMCLLYVGVEEHVPFPAQIEGQLRAFLGQNAGG